jgi:hypothetical protein
MRYLGDLLDRHNGDVAAAVAAILQKEYPDGISPTEYKDIGAQVAAHLPGADQCWWGK